MLNLAYSGCVICRWCCSVVCDEGGCLPERTSLHAYHISPKSIKKTEPIIMIDLSYLNEEEQEAIMAVLKRDAELKKAEEERVK